MIKKQFITIETNKVFVASVHGEFDNGSYFDIVGVFNSKTTAMNQLKQAMQNVMLDRQEDYPQNSLIWNSDDNTIAVNGDEDEGAILGGLLLLGTVEKYQIQ